MPQIKVVTSSYYLSYDFSVKISYRTIIDAIPVEWRRLLKGTTVLPTAISFEEQPHLKISEDPIPISLMTNRKVFFDFSQEIKNYFYSLI